MESSSVINNNTDENDVHVVEIYENERTWIGGGFSKRGLLPTDRGRYSTLDGSASFPTLPAAADALLLPGYVWCDDDNTTFVPAHKDDSWYYARDFSQGALAKATPNKALLHLVRFRTLQRRVKYDPRTLFVHDDPMTVEDIVAKCSYGDSVVLQELSHTLVEVVTYLSQLHGKAFQPPTTTAVGKAQRQVAAVLADPTLPYRSSQRTPQERVTALQAQLVTTAQRERNQPQHVLSAVEMWENRNKPTQSTQKDQDAAAMIWKEQCDNVRRRHFPQADIWAGWILRILDDPEFTLHCATPHCTPDVCPLFAHVACPNKGCGAILSQKYWTTHVETTCPYTIITCPTGCTMTFPRRQLQHHLLQDCLLRETPCPFARMGCTTTCTAADLPVHMAQNTERHLLLAMQRLMEFQTTLTHVQTAVQQLQTENQALREQCTAQQTQTTATARTQQRTVQQWTKRVQQVEDEQRKARKHITELERRVATHTHK